jgi:transmembrane sensor
MTNLPQPDWRTIDRYLTGEASAAERDEIDAWVAADPRRATLLETLRRAPHAVSPAFDVDRAWDRFDQQRSAKVPARVLTLDRSSARSVQSVRSVRSMRNVWRFAAAAMLVLAAGTVWQVARMRDLPAEFSSERVVREWIAAAGKRSTFTLDDGTRVTLNGGSRLMAGEGYGVRMRDVSLDGEGFFEVRHDAARPFRVHARGSVAEDLGTRFSVRAYAAQPLTVAVAEGLVSLRRDSVSDAGVTVAAGDVGIMNETGVATVSHAASLDRYVAWANGSLVLDNLPLRDAALEVEHWYGVHVVIADSALARRPVMARFHGETAEQALAAIALALGARAERNGSTYTLQPAR